MITSPQWMNGKGRLAKTRTPDDVDGEDYEDDEGHQENQDAVKM